MSYKSWFENHSNKHQTIINKISDFTDDEIIKYFRYDNMAKKEIDFCPLYKDNKKCHQIEDLNCYLCGCSNFRLDANKSYCDIDSIDGGKIVGKNGFVHQDCSNCTVPHKEDFIKKVFNRSWKKMMEEVL